MQRADGDEDAGDGAGMRGRKPKPAEERRRDGNASHRPDPDPILVGGRLDEGEAVKAPPNLSRHMRAVWLIVVEDLRNGGLLDRADLVTVEAFAVALGRAREIRAALRLVAAEVRKAVAADEKAPAIDKALAAGGFGHLLADAVRGTQAHPLLSQERGFLTEARQIGEHLGLSAVARTRLGLESKGSLKPKSMETELERKLGRSPRFKSIEGGKAG